jgi:predicted nucleic acid-binding protein
LKPVVIDASFALALVLPDESSTAAERLVRSAAAGEVRLLTAGLWPIEMANGLLQAARRRRIAAQDRLIAHDFLLGLPVTVADEQIPASVLFTLADEERLTVYDACYLALAIERGARLATTDSPLRKAARRHSLLWQSSAR